MALPKQSVSIPFATSIDTKTDPLQVGPMSMLALDNVVYTKDKRIQKRNGFADLSTLPAGTTPLALTTFKNNLEVIADQILAYNPSSETWVERGRYQACEVSTVALSNSSLGKTRANSVTNGELILSSWRDSDNIVRYQVSNASTSQVLLGPIALPATALQATPCIVGENFVLLYITGPTPTLSYIAIPYISLLPTSPVVISSQVESTSCGLAAATIADTLYIAWSGSDVGGSVRLTRLSATLSPFITQVVATGSNADLLVITQGNTNVWLAWYEGASTSTHVAATNFATVTVLSDTIIDSTLALTGLTAAATDKLDVILAEDNTYSFSSEQTDTLYTIEVQIGGTFTAPTVIKRGLSLASHAFLYLSTPYFLTQYVGEFQPTYFLVDIAGNIIAKLAYANAGATGGTLSQVTLIDSIAHIAYLKADLVVSVAKNVDSPDTNNIYTQAGINQASFNLAAPVSFAEIANNLHLSGGYVWMYDGTQCVEHNFHVWPSDLEFTPGSGGSMTAQDYQYAVTYEWTDAQGNIHRSAPSVPQLITVGASGNVTLDIPTLRLTSKTSVRIVIYRWSTAQQSFYQITSFTSPLLNDTTVDSVQYVDTAADASILGNNLLYTTGGVVENIAYPAASSLALYQSRLMVLSSENRDLIYYSKLVLEATPVEPSDLFTIYLAPSTGTAASTGSISVLASMDDKFLMFKRDAIYYLTGGGPNDLGGNNTFSEPTFIASTVGCTNQRSLALIPQGMMFQSNKGVWLLGRGLSTEYIGAPVEDYNNVPIISSVVVPGTNEVRLMLDNNLALMYDYYYGRWGTFSNIPSIASTLYNNLHTYLSDALNGSVVRQETIGSFLDGSKPVLISFTTAWMNLAGLQGLERVYSMFLIGKFISPHKLVLSIGYDYQDDPSQQVTIVPDNYSAPYAVSPTIYAQTGPYAGVGSLEQWQVFFDQQKVQSVQVSVQELYDSTSGAAPGGGLTLSGLNFILGIKKLGPLIKASRSAG
jgi:hypothetical protein